MLIENVLLTLYSGLMQAVRQYVLFASYADTSVYATHINSLAIGTLLINAMFSRTVRTVADP